MTSIITIFFFVATMELAEKARDEDRDDDVFHVGGMMCAANCAVQVEQSVLAVEGVASANVNFEEKRLFVRYDGSVDKRAIREEVGLAVLAAGYDVDPIGNNNIIFLHVDGMTCEHCVQTARKALLSVDGVSSVCVNLNRKIATITIDKAHNSTSLNSALSNAIEEVGFEANSCSYGSREITIDATKLLRDDSTRSAKNIDEDEISASSQETLPSSSGADSILSSLKAIPGVSCAKINTNKTSENAMERIQMVIRGNPSFEDVVIAAQRAGLSLGMHTFSVSGMMCTENCAVKVKNAALAVDGIHAAEVDFDKNKLHILYSKSNDESDIHDDVAISVQSAGYDVEWAGKNNLLYVKIDGMMCDHCVNTVRHALLEIDGVRHVAVSLEQRIAAVAVDSNVLSRDEIYKSILDTVESIGFGAESYSGVREMTLQINNKKGPSSDESQHHQDNIDTTSSPEVLNTLRSLPGVACVKESDTKDSSDVHGFKFVVRGTIACDELLATPALQNLDAVITSVEYDDSLRNEPTRVFDRGKGRESDVDKLLFMKRSSALLMEEMSNISDMVQTHSRLPLHSVASSKSNSSELTRSVFSVKGMSCGACVSAVERVVRKHDCVKKVSVALLTEKLEVEYESSKLSSDQIIEDVSNAGYGVSLISSSLKGADLERCILVVSSIAQTDSELELALSSALARINEMDGVNSAEWLKDDALRMMLKVASEYVNEECDMSNGALILKTSYNDSCIGLRSIFDSLCQDPKYSCFILPSRGEGADIFNVQKKSLEAMQRSFFIALSLTLPLAVLMWSHTLNDVMVVPGLSVMAVIAIVLATPVQFYSGFRFFSEAYRGFLSGTYGMALLIALGTLSAYAFGLYSVVHSALSRGKREAHADHIMTAAMLITFMLLGKLMEIRAKLRTSSALQTLMDRQPKSAILLGGEQNESSDDEEKTNAAEREIPIELVQQNDVVKVIRGMAVPADGEVIFGQGDANEALITGESLPVNKTVGSQAIGGTILVDGMLHVLVKSAPESSMLQQIIQLVEHAQMEKAPIQQLADAIAGVFTLIIITCALVVFVLWMVLLETNSVSGSILPSGMSNFNIAFTLGVSTLVVACPCAMGLATPTAIMVGTGIGAKLGILLKGGDTLEKANKISAVVFDKTGTLTMGSPSVTGIVFLSLTGDSFVKIETTDGSDDNVSFCRVDSTGSTEADNNSSFQAEIEFSDRTKLLQLVGSAELSSEHVLGRAIVQFVQSHPDVPPLAEPDEMTAVTGKGLKCIVEGSTVLIGSLSYLQEENVKHSDSSSFAALAGKFQGKGAIVVFVAVDGIMCCFLQLADNARKESRATVHALQNNNIDVWMVTGDNQRTAEAMGAIVGIPVERIVAGALPNTKIDHVKKLQMEHTVGFVGDGINDAPALAQADVGFAVGGGTDVAIESADIVLMREDIFSVVWAIDLSQAIISCIKRNLFWALAYNTSAIPIAAGLSLVIFKAIIPPWVAGGAMAMSSVSVVLSSLTLTFYSPPNQSEVNQH